MPTLLSISQNEPFPMSTMTDGQQPTSYKEIIKQLAAQAPKPYGAIPPLLKKRKKKSSKHRSRRKSPDPEDEPQQLKPTMRRMSHVEDWIVVDSKESLPDEEELTHPFSTFLSAGFLTQVLPLHMPPPSLSDPATEIRDAIAAETTDQVQSLDDALDEEDEEEATLRGRVVHANWKSDGEEADEDDEEDEDDDDEGDSFSVKSVLSDNKTLVRRHSITSFSKAQTPSTSTTASYVMSSSPPRPSDMQQVRLAQTIAKLRWSLVVSSPPPSPVSASPESLKKKSTTKAGLIPMPPPPRRPASQRRRSEATTKPRFNPETNTYTRDTRSNPDHLRIIVAELRMMRHKKLLSPLKPRGFLPRRKDPFIKGTNRKISPLRFQVEE
ncbi:hypothetical protein O0I10_005860 [Lichtheimia ornata]|uniref:Uncharacterized protein n=1 Tax=Lichtheimia ornata TaxID=688661 RepID=A0AAD7Y1F5_9FUNG|nr:uncharacterized protein O0I10_005860 [Lichtheimia ornata]KAJ8658507.1 hypothetical protein O0I10_005860 [Lichtheimia ornata]